MTMLPSGFIPVTLDLYDDYKRYFDKTPQPTADISFSNLWGWAENYGLGLSFGKDLCWICQTKPAFRLWTPVGDWEVEDWEAAAHKGGAVFRVPEKLAEILRGRLPGAADIAEDRAEWEYLYDREELVALPGAKFHKKKNHVNIFKKTYASEYRKIDDPAYPGIIEDVLRLQEQWCQWRDCENSPSLIEENDAIFRIAGNWGRIPGLCGGALYVDGNVVAFSIGEKIGDMMIVHFEKARTDFRGSYQAINQAFAQFSAEGVRFINREQDLGELGLRQAKETYNPVGFLKKYRVVFGG